MNILKQDADQNVYRCSKLNKKITIWFIGTFLHRNTKQQTRTKIKFLIEIIYVA